MVTHGCTVGCLIAIALGGFVPQAHAELRPVVQIVGRVSVSVDAEGNNNPAGGTVRVQKPLGGTVRSAYLLAAGLSNRFIADGHVRLLGAPVTWQRQVVHDAFFSAGFWHNVFADVTAIVKPSLDAATPGILSLPVTEVDTTSIDGTLLVVVFNDPSVSHDKTVVLLFGQQNTNGDRFSLQFAQPWLSTPTAQATFGLGISYGFQASFPTGQFSVIDVSLNGVRLTSSAGGEDDGISANGGLITVGGIGDNPANPQPFASAVNFRTDDELYDLRPFLANGTRSLDVFTRNPSGDDNVFFAYVVTSAASAILPPVPKPSARTLVGNIIPGRATIVLTHGLQPQPEDGEEGQAHDSLWTGSKSAHAGTLIEDDIGSAVNIVQYIWEEAFQPHSCASLNLPDDEAYKAAQAAAVDAGTRLATELSFAVGPDYSQPIHFIGHSLGTAVNTYAARAFLLANPKVRLAQFTALDRPHHVAKICGMTSGEQKTYGYDSDFFAANLTGLRDDLEIRIDNYYAGGWFSAGVGDVANGKVYNHKQLVDPNDLDDGVFGDETFDNDHTGVHQWYRWTMKPVDHVPDGSSVCDGDKFADGRKPSGLDDSLKPCNQGWHWSLFKNRRSFPPTNGNTVTASNPTKVELRDVEEFGCDVDSDASQTRLTCREASSPFMMATIDIPPDAKYLSFKYEFTSPGDGDYIAVLLDDIPIWVVSSSSAPLGVERDSGLIPVDGFVGSPRITVALNGVGVPGFAFTVHSVALSTIVSGCAPDMSNQLSVTRGAYRLDRRTGRFVQTVTLTNHGPAIAGPLSLALDGLASTVTLWNQNGATSCAQPTGSPVINVGTGSDTVLSTGESTTITLQFTNPKNQTITYSTRVLAGSAQR